MAPVEVHLAVYSEDIAFACHFEAPCPTLPHYRAAACDVICLEAVVLPGGKTMGRLYGNGRKIRLVFTNQPCFDY